jgi:hypothetical protein
LGHWAFLIVYSNCYLEGLKLLEKESISAADIYWKYFDLIFLNYFFLEYCMRSFFSVLNKSKSYCRFGVLFKSHHHFYG